MKAKTYLNRAFRLDLKINTKIEQLEHLRELSYKITSIIREDKVSCSGPKSKMEEAVIKVIMVEHAINEAIDRFVDTRNDISKKIGLLVNEDEMVLLELRYLCFNSWEQIAVKMNYSISYVYKLHQSALLSFEHILNSERKSV